MSVYVYIYIAESNLCNSGDDGDRVSFNTYTCIYIYMYNICVYIYIYMCISWEAQSRDVVGLFCKRALQRPIFCKEIYILNICVYIYIYIYILGGAIP